MKCCKPSESLDRVYDILHINIFKKNILTNASENYTKSSLIDFDQRQLCLFLDQLQIMILNTFELCEKLQVHRK